MKIFYGVSPNNYLNILKFCFHLKLLVKLKKFWFLHAPKKIALKHLPITQDRNENWKK